MTNKNLFIIFSIIGGYLCLIIFDNFSNHHHYNLCLFDLATGFPCPGCGMGRATLALLNGDIPLSFSYNMLCIPFTFTIIISLCWAAFDLFSVQKTFLKFIKQDLKLKYKFLLFSLILIDWSLNIIRL